MNEYFDSDVELIKEHIIDDIDILLSRGASKNEAKRALTHAVKEVAAEIDKM